MLKLIKKKSFLYLLVFLIISAIVYRPVNNFLAHDACADYGKCWDNEAKKCKFYRDGDGACSDLFELEKLGKITSFTEDEYLALEDRSPTKEGRFKLYINLAELHYNRGEYIDAIRALGWALDMQEEMPQDQPDFVVNLNSILELYLKMKHLQEAEELEKHIEKIRNVQQ